MCCWSSYSGGSLQPWAQTTRASRSFSPDPLEPIRIAPLAFWATSPSPVSPQPVPIPGICHFPLDQQWVAQHHKYHESQLGSAWLTLSTPDSEGGRDHLSSHSCSEGGPIRAFEDRGIGCLSRSRLFMNLLYLFYRFPGSHMPRKVPVIGQASLQGRIIWSIREWGPWTSPPHCQQRVGLSDDIDWFCTLSLPPLNQWNHCSSDLTPANFANSP